MDFGHRGTGSARARRLRRRAAPNAGQRVVHAAQHLHGGVGIDREYPLHRYLLGAEQLELTLGRSTSQLLRPGKLLADEAG